MKRENEYVTLILESGILIGIYNNKTRIDLEGAKEVIRLRVEMCENITYPLMVDGRSVYEVTKEARDYFGSEKGYELVSAAAIISDSLLSRTIANFLINVNFHKTPIPVRLFSSKEMALEWLEQYK